MWSGLFSLNHPLLPNKKCLRIPTEWGTFKANNANEDISIKKHMKPSINHAISRVKY